MGYITFSTLGESGGMCSQLQSYASLLAVAKANNKEVVFAKSMFDKGCGIKIFDLLNITPNIKPDSFFKDFILKQINFQNIADYLVVAAELTRIKSRSLLPQDEVEEGNISFDDFDYESGFEVGEEEERTLQLDITN